MVRTATTMMMMMTTTKKKKKKMMMMMYVRSETQAHLDELEGHGERLGPVAQLAPLLAVTLLQLLQIALWCIIILNQPSGCYASTNSHLYMARHHPG
jgi:hypothetical protein